MHQSLNQSNFSDNIRPVRICSKTHYVGEWTQKWNSIRSYTSRTAHDTKLAMSNGLSNAIGKSPSVSTISKKIKPEKEPFQEIQNTENKTVMIDSSTTSKSQFSFYNCSVNILNQWNIMQTQSCISLQHTVLAGIKFGGWALNRHLKNIGNFKFGGSVRDRHTYICKYWQNLIWQLQTRLPNRQI